MVRHALASGGFCAFFSLYRSSMTPLCQAAQTFLPPTHFTLLLPQLLAQFRPLLGTELAPRWDAGFALHCNIRLGFQCGAQGQTPLLTIGILNRLAGAGFYRLGGLLAGLRHGNRCQQTHTTANNA